MNDSNQKIIPKGMPRIMKGSARHPEYHVQVSRHKRDWKDVISVEWDVKFTAPTNERRGRIFKKMVPLTEDEQLARCEQYIEGLRNGTIRLPGWTRLYPPAV